MRVFGIGAGFQFVYTLRLIAAWHADPDNQALEDQLIVAIYGSADSVTALGAIVALGATDHTASSISFQRFMFAGSMARAVAAIFYAGFPEYRASVKHRAAGNNTLADLHLLRSGLSYAGGAAATYSGMAFIGPHLQSGVRMSASIAPLAARVGTRALLDHALALTVGVRAGWAVLIVSVLMDQHTPNELEKWMEKCALGKGKDHFKTTDSQLQA